MKRCYLFYLTVICLALLAVPVSSNASDSPAVSLKNVTAEEAVEDLPFVDFSFDMYSQAKETQIEQTSQYDLELTDGLPVGEQENVKYTIWRSDPNETRGTIHGLTCQKLDNGYTRFTLQYTVPEMFCILVFDHPNGDMFKMRDYDKCTTSERSILRFDIRDEDLISLSRFCIKFLDINNDGSSLLSVNCYPNSNEPGVDQISFEVTEGTPVTEPEEVAYQTRNYWTDGKNVTIYSFTMVELSNYHYRYSVTFSAPEGYKMTVFDSDGSAFRIFSKGGYTTSAQTTVQFDVPKSFLGDLIISFYNSDNNGAGMFWIVFKQVVPICFELTAGTPVTEPEAVEYQTINYWTDGRNVTIHSFSKAELNNSHIRYSLSFTAPEGYRMGMFSDDESVFQLSEGDYTTSAQTTVQFDVPKSLLSDLKIVFYNSDNNGANMFYIIVGSSIAHTHDLMHHESKAPTCTEVGWDEYDTCSRCDYTTYVEKPALGHDWNNAVYEWGENNTSITATRTCKNDPSHTESETVDAAAIIQSPTEESEGSITYVSSEFSVGDFTVQSKSIEIPALKNMSVIRLPAMLTVIEDEAFENLACEAIIIPNGCTSIGNHAFRNCKNLKYIKAPASIDIPANAFDGCANVIIDRTNE